ncbi:hypothetical protein WAI453_000639 [Rhynchosporium graminicola]
MIHHESSIQARETIYSARKFTYEHQILLHYLSHTILRLLPQNSTEDERIEWILRGFYGLQNYASQYWYSHIADYMDQVAARKLEVPRYLIEQLNEIVKYSKGSDHTGGPNQSAGFANVKNANTTDRSASLRRKLRLSHSGPVRRIYHGSVLFVTNTRLLWKLFFIHTFRNILHRSCKASEKCTVHRLSLQQEKHEPKHRREFRCEIDTCVGFKMGFATRAQLGKHTRTYHPELYDDLTLAEAIKAVKRQHDLSGQVNSEPKQSVRSTVKLSLKAYEAHAGELPARNKVLKRSQAQQELFEFMNGPPLVTPQQPHYRHEADQINENNNNNNSSNQRDARVRLQAQQTMQQAARAQQQRLQQQRYEQGDNREISRPNDQMTSLLKQISPHVLKDIRDSPFLRENMRQLPQPNKADALQQSDPLQGGGPGFGFLNRISLVVVRLLLAITEN